MNCRNAVEHEKQAQGQCLISSDRVIAEGIAAANNAPIEKPMNVGVMQV